MIKTNQGTNRPILLFEAARLWGQGGSAGKSRLTARPGARPGQGCAAPGQSSFILPDERANSGKNPLLPPQRPVWREAFQANPPRFFLPPGSNVEGGPRGVGALGARRLCGSPRCCGRGSPALLRGSGIFPELCLQRWQCWAAPREPPGPAGALRTLPSPGLRTWSPALAASSGLQSTTKNVRF